MKVKANKKIYDVLEFTNNRDEIENFAGKGSIVKTVSMELDSWHSMNMQLIAQEKLFGLLLRQ